MSKRRTDIWGFLASSAGGYLSSPNTCPQTLSQSLPESSVTRPSAS
jgi:hypothetical protein